MNFEWILARKFHAVSESTGETGTDESAKIMLFGLAPRPWKIDKAPEASPVTWLEGLAFYMLRDSCDTPFFPAPRTRVSCRVLLSRDFSRLSWLARGVSVTAVISYCTTSKPDQTTLLSLSLCFAEACLNND